MKQTYSNVIVVGSVAYDEIMDFPGKFVDHFHPENLHQINVSFAVSNLDRQLGGTATNITYNLYVSLHFLDRKNKIHIVSAIGKDGKDFIDFFTEHSIDTKGLLTDTSVYTGTGKVITDIKDNQIWGFYYGANKSAKELDLRSFVNKDSLLILSATHPDAFLHFQKQAIGQKISYMYDPGMSLTWIKDYDLKEGVYHAEYLIGNDYEISMISKRLDTTLEKMIDKGLKIIITLGEKGVRYHDDKCTLEVKGIEIKKVIDPTGAGDAWRGGFIAGLISDYPLRDCLKLGNVIAGFAVESYGTVNHVPDQSDIEMRFNSV